MRFVLIFYFFLISFSANCQIKKYGFGFAGNNTTLNSNNYSSAWAYQVDFNCLLSLKEHFIFIGPSFATQKVQHKTLPNKIQNNFLEVPILYQINRDKKEGISIRSGMVFRYNLRNTLFSLDGSKTNGLRETILPIRKPTHFGLLWEIAFGTKNFSSPFISFQHNLSKFSFDEKQGQLPFNRLNLGIRLDISQMESNKAKTVVEKSIETQKSLAKKTKTSYFLFALRNEDLEMKNLGFREDSSTISKEVNQFNRLCLQMLDSVFDYRFLTFDQQYLDHLLNGNLTYIFTTEIARTLEENDFFIVLFGDYFLDESDLVRTGLYVFDRKMNLIPKPFPNFVNYPNITRKMFHPQSIQEMILKFCKQLDTHQLDYGF